MAMPDRFLKIKNIPRAFAVLLGVLALVVVGCLDFVTIKHISMLVFYFIPVCVFAWFLGFKWGLLAAGACTAVWYPNLIKGMIDENHPVFDNEMMLTVMWNIAIRFFSLSVVALLVDWCKRLTIKVDTLVEQRTEALQTELEMQKRSDEQIRKLTSQLSEAESQQRRALAQELHDSLGQDLSALKLGLQSMMSDNSAQTSAGSTRVRSALDVVDGLIRRTRTMTFELHPPMLDDLGLAPTLHRFAQGFTASTGVQVEIGESGELQPMSSGTRASLFRAVKELVHNAAKHGGAKEVTVSILWQSSRLRIVVDDDGHGFALAGAPRDEKESTQNHGLGLKWIQERLRVMGGSFYAESEPDSHGTRIIMEIALSPEANLANSEFVV
jgi:signal transduction histidine kinase